MTFNIRYANPDDGINYWDNRRELVARVIHEHNPDILGVQEALERQLNELRERLPSYDWVGVGRDDGISAGEFAPIFYKPERLTLLESGTFWFSSTPGVPGSASYGNTLPRICTWARFDAHHTERSLLVANVHLDHQSGESRMASMLQLRDWIRTHAPDEDVFVLGDFNCTPDSEPMRVLLDDGWRIAIDNDHAQGTMHRFTGSPGARIDMILVPNDARTHEGAVITTGGDGGVWPSDHFPVWTSVRFE
ncbi:MAG: endonuclease/exonuclease/phosphatase family protein [Planctomycetota bacterium]